VQKEGLCLILLSRSSIFTGGIKRLLDQTQHDRDFGFSHFLHMFLILDSSSSNSSVIISLRSSSSYSLDF
jgi:hypothetical protein